MLRLLSHLFPLALALATTGLSGCATIVKGTTQAIPISSDPAGARVAVDGKPAGTTPTTVTMNRKHSHMVTLEHDAYEVENIPVTNSMGAAVAGNIIAGGLIGWGVDAMSGAQYNLHPATVTVKLRAKSPVPATPPPPAMDALAQELARLEALRAGGKLTDAEYTQLRAALLTAYPAPPPPADPATAK